MEDFKKTNLLEFKQGNYLVDDFYNESFDNFLEKVGLDNIDLYQKFIKKIVFENETCPASLFNVFENYVKCLSFCLKFSKKENISINVLKHNDNFYIICFYIKDLSFIEEHDLSDEINSLNSKQNNKNRFFIRKSFRTNKVKEDLQKTALISFYDESL